MEKIPQRKCWIFSWNSIAGTGRKQFGADTTSGADYEYWQSTMKPRSGCGLSIKIILTYILLSAKAMRRYSNFIRRYTSNAKPSCNDADRDDHSLIRRFAALVNPFGASKHTPLCKERYILQQRGNSQVVRTSNRPQFGGCTEQFSSMRQMSNAPRAS